MIADFEIQNVLTRPIHQVMRPSSSDESRTASWPEYDLAFIGHQSWVALEHIDEFVLLRMTVAQCRLRAWFEAREVDAEVSQPEDLTEPSPFAPSNTTVSRS